MIPTGSADYRLRRLDKLKGLTAADARELWWMMNDTLMKQSRKNCWMEKCGVLVCLQ